MRGSLQDIGIGELIQFPSLSAKTGCIEMIQGDRRAALYYVNGELHHAEMGDLVGLPVLVELLAWREGRFEFQPDLACPQRSIDMDLGKALMQATLAQPEPQAAESPHIGSTAGFNSFFGPTWDSATFARVSTFLSEHPLFFYACVMTRSGKVRAEFTRPAGDLSTTTETLTLLRDILKNYASFCDAVSVIDSSYCVVALHPFGESQVVVALAKADADEGEVQAAIEGLVVKLEDPFQL